MQGRYGQISDAPAFPVDGMQRFPPLEIHHAHHLPPPPASRRRHAGPQRLQRRQYRSRGQLVPTTRSSLTAGNDYVILGKGNQLPANLAALVATAGGTLTSTASQIGVATASSADPNFGTAAARIGGVQAVALDQVVQWISPTEHVPDAGEVTEDVGQASHGKRRVWARAIGLE